MLNIQTEQGASNKKMRVLAKSMRRICGRTSVEPLFDAKMIEENNRLDIFYKCEELDFLIENNRGYKKRTLVYVHDIESLIWPNSGR